MINVDQWYIVRLSFCIVHELHSSVISVASVASFLLLSTFFQRRPAVFVQVQVDELLLGFVE